MCFFCQQRVFLAEVFFQKFFFGGGELLRERVKKKQMLIFIQGFW